MQITTLANGLRIISEKREHTQTVSLGLWVNTGSAYEANKINGISHFLEHMLFKGTPTRSALDISAQIEDVGGQLNAYTSREFTAYYAKMLKNDAELAIDVLCDILQNSTFPIEELQKEQEVVVQEIKQAIDTPDDIIFDYFQELAFPKQAIGKTILGEIKTVRSFSQETLKNYIKSNYAGANMIACAVGNIEHADFVKMVEQRLGSLQPKTNFEIELQKYVGGSKVEKRKIEQAHVILGFDGFDYYSPFYYPNLIFSSLFGGGMSSRLFQEIREKRGLAYTVYSFGNSHTKNGLFGIYAGTTKDELKMLVPVICEEIVKVRNQKVGEHELLRAKNQLKASMLMSLESSSSSSEIFSRQQFLFNRFIPSEEMIAKIDAVSLDNIQEVANKLFASKPTYTLLGAIDKYLEYDKIEKLIGG